MTPILELLDSARGLPLQAWTVSPGRVWQIGRSETSDIVIGNPLVSRTHAYLEEHAGTWRLVGVSEKGIWVGGERCESVEVTEGLEFRLSSRGPLFRIRLARHETPEERPAVQATICFDEQAMPMLFLDLAQRDQEVESIVRDDYFQSVQQLAARMRSRRSPQRPGVGPDDPTRPDTP